MGLGVVASIAVSTVSRWLLLDKIRPWRYHNWQHILDPQEFLQRARPILRLYETAQMLLRVGIWVVCADEKTSIQARQRERVVLGHLDVEPFGLTDSEILQWSRVAVIVVPGGPVQHGVNV